MPKDKNRNIRLLRTKEDLNDEISYDDFEFKTYFKLLCHLKANNQLERLDIEVVDKANFSREGLVYVFVIANKIFKIGHTIGTIKDRIQSYNCGKQEYRISGTCSTTNYFVLQSFLKIGENVDVYAFFPDIPEYELFGKKYKDSFPIPKRAENQIICEFMKNHNKKPIGCTQR